MSLLIALIPALIAVWIFHATCRMQSTKAAPKHPRAPLSDHTPPPPTFGSVA
ncbi:MAG: hypothetical protein KIT72_09650 [Polyangiaceae bacterium]|nr:hypothetical protein [Polyangiaceae bacterium]MCW5790672.1 hypothetical protein [Polyangiaceae bacterium]